MKTKNIVKETLSLEIFKQKRVWNNAILDFLLYGIIFALNILNQNEKEYFSVKFPRKQKFHALTNCNYQMNE